MIAGPALRLAAPVSMELRRAAAAMKAIATYCKAMDDRDVGMADIAINESATPAFTALTVVEDLIIGGMGPAEAIDRVLRCVAS